MTYIRLALSGIAAAAYLNLIDYAIQPSYLCKAPDEYYREPHIANLRAVEPAGKPLRAVAAKPAAHND